MLLLSGDKPFNSCLCFAEAVLEQGSAARAIVGVSRFPGIACNFFFGRDDFFIFWARRFTARLFSEWAEFRRGAFDLAVRDGAVAGAFQDPLMSRHDKIK